MTTKRATKTPGATETTPEQTPAVDQPTIVLDEAPTQEAPTQEAPTSDVGSTDDTALPDMPTPGEMWETIQLLKQQLAAQQKQPKQAKAVAPHVPTSEAAPNTGRWVLTPNGWAVKEIV